MFQIVDGKLMPSFASIEGMGDKAAEAVEEAGKDGPYLSLDDFRQRTKVNKTVIDLMSELGLFGNLPKSNQLSLFDFKGCCAIMCITLCGVKYSGGNRECTISMKLRRRILRLQMR